MIIIKNGDRLIQSLRCVCLCELSSDGVRTKNDRNGVPESYIVVTNDDSSIGNVQFKIVIK